MFRCSALKLWRVYALAAALGGVCAGARAEAAELPPPLRHVLKLEQELGDLLALDVNGDGLLDLISLEVDQSRRDGPVRARVFVQTPTGFLPPAGAGDLLPPELVLAGAGLFSQGPGLALLTPAGVAIWIWRGDRFVPDTTIPIANVFSSPTGGLQTGLVWVVDLNGDGLSELLVPRPDGFTLLTQDASGHWQSGGLLRTRARGQLLNLFRRKVAGYDLPALFVLGAAEKPSLRAKQEGKSESNAAPWSKIVAFSDGILYVFQPDGNAAVERPPVFQQDVQPPVAFDPAAPFDPPLQLIAAQDLNGDGLLDLVFTKTKSGDSDFNARTRTLIHYGKTAPGGLSFASEPDQVFDSEGFSLPFFVDLNRDQRADLVLVNVEVSFWTAIKALIARSVTAEAGFYLMSGTGRYSREPDAKGKFSVKFSLGRASHQPVALFGDFNGDGLPDLLLSVDKDKLGLHFGHPTEFWANGPDEVIEDRIPLRGDRVRILDLNGDGQDDLVLLYNRDDIRAMPETNRTITVLLSRFAAQKAKPSAPGNRPGLEGIPDAPPPNRRMAALSAARAR